MKCDEASEFVSAICDGATIPPTAAEHINSCEHCRAQLKEYLEMGVELRRMASLERTELPPLQLQPARRSLSAILWSKGRKTMRIPRVAFAALLAAIVVLSSGWARQSVRADSQGTVLFMQYTLGQGPARFCAISAVSKKTDGCGGVNKVKAGWLVWEIRVLSKAGDRATLGVRTKFDRGAVGASSGETEGLPEQQYELTPGETLKVNVEGSETINITGQWIDHMPAIAAGEVGENHDIDPGPGELRFVSPLLLREGLVVGDLEGASTGLNKPDQAVDLYMKDAGRFDLALSPMPGAVEGRLSFNRIAFTIDGQKYTFVTGIPISRVPKIWVLYRPKPPAWNTSGSSYLGGTEIKKLFSDTTQN